MNDRRQGAAAYLDHAATSPMPERVLEAYLEALRTVGNPASTHGHGQRASEVLEDARARIARGLGCDHAEVILTSGGTESINLALKGMYWARARGSERTVILVPEGEHHATVEAAEWLRDTQGATIEWLPIDGEGRLQPAVVRETIERVGAHRVALLTFLWANNEVGTVQPVAELCAVAIEHGVPAHVDAVSALGQLPIDFARSGAAAVSVSAHKIGGPVGVGALVLGRLAQADPLVHGGTQQRARSGTQDVAGAVAFAAALDVALGEDASGDPAGNTAPAAARTLRLEQLRDRLIAGVRAADSTAVLRGSDPAIDPASRLPGNAHFTFPGCQGDSLVFLLDAAGISVSVGSACQAGVAETSHVLLALGLSEQEAAGALRFTLSPDTDEATVAALCAALPDALSTARKAGLN